MKKYLLILAMFLYACSASAQMNEMLGVLAVDGALSSGDADKLGKMQNALGRAQFQQDLSLLNSEIQLTYMGNYSDVSKSNVFFRGFKGISWDIGPSKGGNEYYVEFKGLDSATCFVCKNRAWNANKVEINGGGDCTNSNNHVKMYF